MPDLNPRQFQIDVDGAGLEERSYTGLKHEDLGDDYEFTGRLLHASNHEFTPGDVVMPSAHVPRERRPTSFEGYSSPDHAYAFAEADEGWQTSRPPKWLGSHLYEVKPLTNDLSDDPNWGGYETEVNMLEAVRSNKGFEVVGKEGHWGNQAGELQGAPSRRTAFHREVPGSTPPPGQPRRATQTALF